MPKQSEAQKEANRLYKLYYGILTMLNDKSRHIISKESAIICAKERQKVMVNTCESDVWIESSKKFYRDVIRELKKL